MLDQGADATSPVAGGKTIYRAVNCTASVISISALRE
jgi:hypothetical protein